MVKEKTTIDDLAAMIKKGFDNTAQRTDVDKRFDGINKEMQAGFKRVDERFSQVNARLDMIEKDIKGFVTQEEFDDVLGRISYMEGKLGIVSGK